MDKVVNDKSVESITWQIRRLEKILTQGAKNPWALQNKIKNLEVERKELKQLEFLGK